jgi:hypothetical protein
LMRFFSLSKTGPGVSIYPLIAFTLTFLSPPVFISLRVFNVCKNDLHFHNILPSQKCLRSHLTVQHVMLW